MNTMTNGASQDIQEATSIARNMVAMYGMSDAVGMVALGSVRNQYLDGGYGLDCAQDTAAIMDREVKRILDECYKDAVQVIRDNREDMDKVVAYLLERRPSRAVKWSLSSKAAIPRPSKRPTLPRARARTASAPRSRARSKRPPSTFR